MTKHKKGAYTSLYSHNSQRLIAYLVYPVALQRLRNVFEVFIGLGDTGEVVLGQLRGEGLESGVNMISRPITGLTNALQQGGVPQQTQGHILEIEQLATALKQYEESVERANLAKDEFMASMSHELRTLLTSIIGNAEYSALVPSPKRQKQCSLQLMRRRWNQPLS